MKKSTFSFNIRDLEIKLLSCLTRELVQTKTITPHFRFSRLSNLSYNLISRGFILASPLENDKCLSKETYMKKKNRYA